MRSRAARALHLMMDAGGQLTAGNAGAAAGWRHIPPGAEPGGPSAAAAVPAAPRVLGECYERFCKEGFAFVPQLVGRGPRAALSLRRTPRCSMSALQRAS